MPTIARANRLALESKRGPVYGPLDLSIQDGLTVLHAPSGSGRTSLLLTLAGRMKPSAGTLETLGRELPRGARRVQRESGIAGFAGIDELEESVTVGAAVRERAAWISPWWAFVRRPDEAALRGILGPVFGESPMPAPDTVIWELDEAQTALLRIALAMMSEPRLLCFDGLDELASPAARLAEWRSLDAIARSGTAVVVSAAAPDPRLWAELGIAPAAHSILPTAERAASAPNGADDGAEGLDLLLEHA
ncbi:ATP-binding cassette domain-containing protein [Agromyces soli]|uniref:ATP-binding cassette domain-containing protein n=1 Tax=Agromyces soli TaxID=659012 RepID=A0ABY4AV03_9MICO|nr:ATP-binding cassette domain-containing protein [Agromyces soli]UOE26994.1 ATP-binding cassette domain-containing protein [Agromyces soli]